MNAPDINIGQLQQEIDELALISENPPPVVTRVLFSAADLKARAHVKGLFRQAGLAVRDDGAGNIKRSARGRFSFPNQFLLAAMVAEIIDQVRLPIHGSIAQIGRIQRGFLVRIVGELLS